MKEVKKYRSYECGKVIDNVSISLYIHQGVVEIESVHEILKNTTNQFPDNLVNNSVGTFQWGI